jgi:hypothetical protein
MKANAMLALCGHCSLSRVISVTDKQTKDHGRAKAALARAIWVLRRGCNFGTMLHDSVSVGTRLRA